MALSDVDLRIVWVRAGGRCVLCKKYLLQGEITHSIYPLGEGAHIVGSKESKRSPRGMDPLPAAQRDTPDNVLLACEKCHGEIDVLLNAKTVDKAFLLKAKAEHEAEIRRLTGMVGSMKTAVVRLVADIRGSRTSLSTSEAVLAVIRSGRIPSFAGAYDGNSEEIDLRDIPGECEPTAAYYEQAAAKIDDVVTRRIAEAVKREEATHLSVFGLARVPVLVYFGKRLDDAVGVQLFQRHRSSDSWVWPEADPGTTFSVTKVRDGDPSVGLVLITNLSGTTPLTDLPAELAEAAVFELTPASGPAEDVIDHPAVLDRFVETVRGFFTGIEATHKEAEHVHLFGALPASPAIALGRILKSSGIGPRLVTYDRIGQGYVKAMVI
jgi:hypothetical protein